VTTLDPRFDEAVVVGDLATRADVREAVVGVDAVLHLACVHGITLHFDESIDANFRATVHLLDEARLAGTLRFVYASSHHVHGLHPLDGFPGDAAEYAPDAYYGLGKAFGELACATFARRYGLRTAVVRIGNADPQVADARSRRLWTSAGDLAQLFAICLTHPDVRHEVVYGVSNAARPIYPNERAHQLGYRPRDHADDHLAPTFLAYEHMPPRLGRDFVGGAHVAAPLPVPEEGP
jgi:uronate dehydrogenase